MRRIIPAVLLFITINSFAQHRLSTSRKTSVYTHIYKINTEEAWTLAKSQMSKAGDHFHLPRN